MKRATLVFGIFFVLFFIILISLFISPKTSENSLSADKISLENGNGAVINIWIDNFSRFDTLKNHGVKYLFVDVGDTGKDGRIKNPEKEIKSFLDFINSYEAQNNYEFLILPYSEIITDDYDITSEVFKDNFVDDYSRLNSMGFEGILVDIEKIGPDQKQSYFGLLERLRERLPKNSVIAAYAGALSDSPNEWEWDKTFYKSVSDRVDIISAPGYDSGLMNEEEYKEYVKNQVGAIVSGNFSSKFLFAIPTHKDPPETIENALEAYSEELDKHPQNNFIGVCVFAEWTADENEWATLEKYIK